MKLFLRNTYKLLIILQSLLVYQVAIAGGVAGKSNRFELMAESIKKQNILSMRGSIFFNVTNSGVQGENYLLNEQLSNIKLYTDLNLQKWGRIHTVFIYNTLPTPVNPRFYFDEAYYVLKKPASNFYLEVGKKWLPYGSYKNDLIYKPLTKALGQTNEYAVILGYDNYFYTNLSLFKPYSPIRSTSLPANYNWNFGLHEKQEDRSYDVGVSYLYSFAESQLMQYNKGFGGFLGRTINSHVPAAAAYGNFRYKKFNTYVTYVSALKAFNENELSYQNSGATPGAVSIQSGYDLEVKNLPFKLIVFYDRSFEALALRLPKQRIGMGLNVYPTKYLDVQFQYFQDDGYGENVASAGLNRVVTGNSTMTNTAALQVVFNFG